MRSNLSRSVKTWRRSLQAVRWLLIGCSVLSGSAAAASNVALEAQVREFVRKDNPDFRQSTPVVLEEYPVAGLAEQNGARLYLARLLGNDGQQFNELLFLYYNKAMTALGSTLGGHGLMSAVLFERRLHYTFSWGSGLHRSHLGRISFSRGNATAVQSEGIANVDLFLRLEGESLIVEAGQFVGFNSWRNGKSRGNVEQVWASVNRIDPAFSSAVLDSSPGVSVARSAATQRVPSDLGDRETAVWIWKNLVPRSGQASSLQGELLRAVEKLRTEAQGNGNINWDDGFVKFVEFLKLHLQAEHRFKDETKAQLNSDLHRLASFRTFDDIQENVRNHHLPPEGLAYVADDLYDRLVACIVEYSRMHPEPIPLQPDPSQYR